MARFTRRLTSVRFEDASGLGLAATPTEGDMTMSETNAENAEHQPVYNRDVHDGFTLGIDLIQEFSITLQQRIETLTHATLARMNDFLHKRGSFVNAVSVDSTIWAFKVIVTFSSQGVTTTRTFPKCEGGAALSEGQPFNSIAVSLRNHQAPVDA